MMGRREQHHNAFGTKERMVWNERRETRSSILNELEKVSLGEGSNRVVGKPTMKRVSLIGLMLYISNYEVTTCHSREKELDWYDQGDEKLFHR